MYGERSDPSIGEIDSRSVGFWLRLKAESEDQVVVIDSLLHDEIQNSFVEVRETSFEGGVNPELILHWGEPNPRC